MSLFESLIEIRDLPNGEIKLVAEDDDGYIEYKLRLDFKNLFGIQKLTSQMNYRLENGKILLGRKEAHYVLGIQDDGSLGNITESEIDKTFAVFSQVVNSSESTIIHIDKTKYNTSYIIYAIVQKIEKSKIKELNIAFVGPSQHGKTTTISHIVYGQHDDGNGYARNLFFKHEHEKVSGITSSVKKEIIGLRSGKLINYSVGIQTSWENIVEISDKVINLIDLPGSDKYAKCTLFGLSAYNIDGIVIVIDLKKCSEKTIKEYMFYKKYTETMKIPFVVACINSEEPSDISDIPNKIPISNLGYKGYYELIDFFDSLEINDIDCNEHDCIFFATEINFIPDVGFTFSGTMRSGRLSLGDDVYLTNGSNYFPAKIKSIQRKQIDSQTLYEKEGGAIRLDVDNGVNSIVTKHMMIVKKKYPSHKSVMFKLLSEDVLSMNIVNNGQRCLLFVDNNIVQTSVSYEFDGYEFELKLTNSNKIIFPRTDKIIAMIKTDDKIAIGEIKII